MAAWSTGRESLRRWWTERLGPYRFEGQPEVRLVSRERLPDHQRLLLRYSLAPDDWTEAYLLLPHPPQVRRAPGMVVLHQTSRTAHRDPVGLDGRESVHLALHLVRRGYVCIAPRNFLWSRPDADYAALTREVLARSGHRTGMARMLGEAIRATDVLLQRPEVDPGRVGSIGHSLGAKEVLYHAAFDPRIRAAVSCEGGIGLRFSNWEAPWYLGPQVQREDFGGDHHEVLALVAPRAFLLIGGGSADGNQSWPYVEAALGAWSLTGHRERVGLLVHPHGHNFPPPGPDRERVWSWLDTFLDGSDPLPRIGQISSRPQSGGMFGLASP